MDAIASKTAAQGLPAYSFYAEVAEDFASVNALIPHQLTSEIELIQAISRYIVQSGGKRLRPLLVLLSANCLDCRGGQHIPLAAIIEFLHTATLLHDDVIDRSELRRGRATANALWGDAPSVLVGDFLYSRAFQMMVEIGQMPLMGILSEATNTIAQGEVMQLDTVGRCDIGEADYMGVIRCKTATLFQAASHSAAVVAGAPAQITEALRDFGLELGLAFQLIDDALDYTGDAGTMGKNIGDDLAEGKVTLPLIHAMQHGAQADAHLVSNAIQQRDRGSLDQVRCAVQASGAIEYTTARAEEAAARARDCLSGLPANRYRAALADLVEFSVARQH